MDLERTFYVRAPSTNAVRRALHRASGRSGVVGRHDRADDSMHSHDGRAQLGPALARDRQPVAEGRACGRSTPREGNDRPEEGLRQRVIPLISFPW